MIIKVPLAFFININLPELYKPEEFPIISLSPKKNLSRQRKAGPAQAQAPAWNLLPSL